MQDRISLIVKFFGEIAYVVSLYIYYCCVRAVGSPVAEGAGDVGRTVAGEINK